MNGPTPGSRAAVPVVQRITPRGTVTRYTPIAKGPYSSATISEATLRQHPECFDLSPQSLWICADGSAWLGSGEVVERLG